MSVFSIRLARALLPLLAAMLASACSRAPLHIGRSVEPRMEILETEQRDGYSCYLIEYNVSDDERVKAFLLLPDRAAAPVPGVVLLHDHGARFDIGKEKLVRPLASAPEHIRRSSEQWIRDNFDGSYYGDSLAAHGFAVIVPEQLYWGSRSSAICQEWSRVRFGGEDGDPKALKDSVYEGQRAVYDSLAAGGTVWAEKTLREDAAAARLLASLPSVGKVGCFGWSMGAHRSWLLAAFCPEIEAGAALCWMTLKSTCANPPTASDYSMMIPSLRSRYDFPDIARWLSPKPFFFLAGTQDRLFPAESVAQAYDIMQDIYAGRPRHAGTTAAETGMQESGNALRTEFFDGPHHCGLAVQKRITAFLDSTLRP